MNNLKYFGMDSFNRDATVYCCTAADNNNLLTLSDAVSSISSSISADKIDFNGGSVSDALKELNKRLQIVENAESASQPVSSSFVVKRLKRADLKLVWGRG